MTPTLRLSSLTARRIDWQRIDDTTRAALDHLGKSRSAVAGSVAADPVFDPHLVREAFGSMKREFQSVLRPLQLQMRFVSGLIFVSLAVTISGAALTKVSLWRGSVLSLAGVGAMFGFLTRAWQLAKDQAMLELIPSRYELALQLAASPEQFAAILNEFLRESNSLRQQSGA